MPLDISDLDRLMTAASMTAEMNFNRDGYCATVWVVERVDDLVVIETPWDTREQKHATITKLKELFKEWRAQRYVLIAEAWMTTVKADEINKGLPPKTDPRRVEIVSLTGEDADGNGRSIFRKIIRSKRGKPRLGPEQKAGETLAGNFHRLLSTGTAH